MMPIEPPSFTDRAAAACPGHAELALALAAEFGSVDVAAADAQLDLVAVELADARTLPAVDQLRALAEAMRAFAVVEPHVGSRDLRVDTALAAWEGHALALVPIAVEAGRRAGLPVGVIGDGARHLVAHRAVEEPVALEFGPAGPGLRGADETSMTWRCAHQLSFTTLGVLVNRGTRGGDLGLALRAAELRLALPLGDDVRRCQEGMLKRLRARLN